MAASAPSVVAVGINCTDPRLVLGLVRRIRAVTDLPIVVYPNAGGQWDPEDGEWHGGAAARAVDVAFPDRLVREWVGRGRGGDRWLLRHRCDVDQPDRRRCWLDQQADRTARPSGQ